jgi:hypothetical protein
MLQDGLSWPGKATEWFKREAGEGDEKALKKDRDALAAYLERDKKKSEDQKAQSEALAKQLI